MVACCGPFTVPGTILPRCRRPCRAGESLPSERDVFAVHQNVRRGSDRPYRAVA
jgi:hypothetical protein